jgi:stress-induced morphogen
MLGFLSLCLVALLRFGAYAEIQANRTNPWAGGCGQMYEAIIVSPQFTKKTTLARHRLVNSTLKDEIAAIHAWTPKCHTPEEWEKKKPQ